MKSGEGRIGVRTAVGTRSAGAQTAGGSSAAAAPARPMAAAGDEMAMERQPEEEQQQQHQQSVVQQPPQEQTASAGPGPVVAPAAPKRLSPKGSTHAADATFGYDSRITYEVLDDAGSPIVGFDVNEFWTTAVVKDDPTTNWPRGNPGGFHSATSRFADFGSVMNAFTAFVACVHLFSGAPAGVSRMLPERSWTR